MLKTVPETRWSCESCAQCCRGLTYGPVEPEVIAGLTEANIASLWPPAANGWAIPRTHPDGSTHTYLAHVDGHCVFLRDDNLCAVHALLGEDKKPGFCREFPYLFVQDATGISASIRETCAGWHHSFVAGAPVDEQRALPSFSAPRVVPRQQFAPAQVVVLPGKAIDTAIWLKLEPKLVTLPSVAAIRALFADLLEVQLPPGDAEEYEAAAVAILEALAQVLTRATEHDPRLAPMATQVRAACTRPRPLLDETGRAFASVVLQNQLLGKRFGAFGSLPVGLGAYLLGVEICAAPTVDRFGTHLAEWSRVASLPPVHRFLRAASAPLTTLFLHAP